MNELKEPTMTQLVALMIFVIFSAFIWIPIFYIFALVNIKAALIIAIMSFVMFTCKIYLGVK